MKVTIKWEETFNLSTAQVELIKRLYNDGAEYLHDEEADLADKTPGISSNDDCKYWIDETGKRILEEMNKKV